MLTNNVSNIIPAGTVLNATRNSSAMQLENMLGYSIQVVITGTPTGTLKLQASCDPVAAPGLQLGGPTYSPTNWTDIANSSAAVSAAGSTFWNMADTFYNFVRVVYTDSSGGTSTATISSATFNAKGA